MRIQTFLYIDPGTGSMLFTVLISVISVAVYFLRDTFVKFCLWITGRNKTQNGEKLSLVIFSDDKRYWNVFEPICDELENRGIAAVYMTSSEDDPALSKTYEHIKSEFIGKGNKAFAKLNSLKAEVVLSTTPSLDVFQWKRSKEVDHYIHIAHAADDITKYRMFGIDYYDSVLLGGEYQGQQVRALEKLRNLPEKQIEYVGMPYLDRMKERFTKAEAASRKDGENITVLLAPSWGASGILSRFGEEFIEVLAETGYDIIIRPHPQSYVSEKELISGLEKRFANTANISWNRDNDNFEVLRKADILISDFSGVLFDFSLVFDKPVIYTNTEFDKAPYDCYWLDEELWTFRILPEIGAELTRENMREVKGLIQGSLQNTVFQTGRERARKETWMHMGEGAKRTVDYIVQIQGRKSDEARLEQASETV